MKRNDFLLLISSLFALFIFSGCVPLIVGGAAAGAPSIMLTADLKPITPPPLIKSGALAKRP